MLLTGGLAMQHEVARGSLAAMSLDQMSPLSSDISTNSNAKIFLITFGNNEAAGLYRPAMCRARNHEMRDWFPRPCHLGCPLQGTGCVWPQ